MAEEPQSVCEWLDIELTRLSGDDKKALIDEIMTTMSAVEIREVRISAESIWERKFTEEKLADMEDLRKRISELALSVNVSIERETPDVPSTKAGYHLMCSIVPRMAVFNGGVGDACQTNFRS